MKKKSYDNAIEKLPRFALKIMMRTLINTYINNQIFFSLKALYILKFFIYIIRNIRNLYCKICYCISI